MFGTLYSAGGHRFWILKHNSFKSQVAEPVQNLAYFSDILI